MKTLTRKKSAQALLMRDYYEPSVLRRLMTMTKGLQQPRQSREYKAACIELQRLAAPVAALIFPLCVILLLLIMTGEAALNERLITTELLKITETVKLQPVEPSTEKPLPSPDIDVALTLDNTDVRVEIEQPRAIQPANPVSQTMPAVRDIKSVVTIRTIYTDSRSGAGRTALRRKFKGDDQTEAAVMRALRWLKKKQQADGSWPRNKVAMTGLALLTFLAHGEYPGESPEFGATVQRGIEFLLRAQNQATGIMPPGNYEHPIATYALCEAYGMTRNPNVKLAAERALRPIIQGQHPTGGWTYRMNPDVDKETGQFRDDTSYMGWCVQALKAAQLAGLHVEGLDKAMKLAVNGFKRNAHPTGGFGYTGPGKGGLTGVGTLCLQMLGAANVLEVKKSLEVMASWTPTFTTYELLEAEMKRIKPDEPVRRDASGAPVAGKDGGAERTTPFEKAKTRLAPTLTAEERRFLGGSAQYYYYYVTQSKFHEGGKAWEAWNAAMKGSYVKAQKVEPRAMLDDQGRECDIGWWENCDQHTDRPVMDTCLTALQLMVYYRSLHTTSAAAVQPEAEILATATDETDIKVFVGNL